MRIAIVYVEPQVTPQGEHWLSRSSRAGSAELIRDSSELSALPDIELISASLAEAGYETVAFAAESPTGLCDFLSRERPELIFNMCDSFADRSDLELNVAALFELYGIPFTGSSALTLGLAQNKPLTKALLTIRGIATPPYRVSEPESDPFAGPALRFPLIVKPAAEDASVGIDDGAVVQDMEALAARVRFVWREFQQAALIEEFIDGREFHVSILATSPGEFMVLPISEIAFDSLCEGRPRILGYDAKWDNGAEFRQTTALRCPAAIEPKIAQNLKRIALEAAKAVGLRDYGRVDLRLRDGEQAPFVLEVNPNPDLNPECKFMRAALESGRSYEGTIREIVEQALERRAPTPRRPEERSRRPPRKSRPAERSESVRKKRRVGTHHASLKGAGKRPPSRLLSKA